MEKHAKSEWIVPTGLSAKQKESKKSTANNNFFFKFNDDLSRIWIEITTTLVSKHTSISQHGSRKTERASKMKWKNECDIKDEQH